MSKGDTQQNNEIIIERASAIDAISWDRYVNSHGFASAYHRFAWLQAVKDAYGHESFGIIAKNKETQCIVGVMPSVLMKTPFLGTQLCALPYCDVGYAIGDNAEIEEQLRQYLVQQVTTANITRLEIRNINSAAQQPESLKHQKVRMLMPLPESSEALLAGFKSKLRSQIRKAEKNGLTTALGTEQKFIDEFYNVYATNMRDLGSPVHAKKWFQQVIKAYGSNSVIGVVYFDGKAIGAGLVIKNNTNASIPWASTLREYNKLAPNMLLYWSLLAHCADNSIECFDFGRSTFEEGTYKFKKQWGAEPQLLNWQKYNSAGRPITEEIDSSQQSKLRSMVESIWQKLPLSITVSAGSLIRPYISL
ncbi:MULTISPECIES: GNAT family N-acetyltransferase [unclassified Alteromonas]|uniref:GNAT family N-acetyltransferase n=1 Tax=unclassified Alteromonas TaxID=2614992 RepID=UPI000691559B|nr:MULTISPECIES: GNAT family N-acetyltransferase [unclassified Alteromonas]